jgi:hypothetical protein
MVSGKFSGFFEPIVALAASDARVEDHLRKGRPFWSQTIGVTFTRIA